MRDGIFVGSGLCNEYSMKISKNHIDLSPEKFNEGLLSHLKEYCRRETFDDDLCLMVVDVL